MPRMTMVKPDGNAIRTRREDLGLSRADLARLAERGIGTIGDVERERWPVSRVLLGQLARALKVRTEELIKQADEPNGEAA